MKAMHSLSRASRTSRELCARRCSLPASTSLSAFSTYYQQKTTSSGSPLVATRLFQSKSKSDQLASDTQLPNISVGGELFPLFSAEGGSKRVKREKVKMSPPVADMGRRSKRADIAVSDKNSRLRSNVNWMGTAGTSSWSSPHDNISRQAFMKNYTHLWTLLEACLDTQNFTRAEDVLINFSYHSAAKDVAVAVNNFLLRFAEVHETDASKTQKWLDDISKKLHMFDPDSVTHAIMLRNICVSSGYDKAQIESYLAQNSPDYEVLKHVDVLGIEMIAKIIEVSKRTFFFFFFYPEYYTN